MMASVLTELILASSQDAGSQRKVPLTILSPIAVIGVGYTMHIRELASVVAQWLTTKAASAAINRHPTGQQIALPPFSAAIVAAVCESAGLLARHAAGRA